MGAILQIKIETTKNYYISLLFFNLPFKRIANNQLQHYRESRLLTQQQRTAAEGRPQCAV